MMQDDILVLQLGNKRLDAACAAAFRAELLRRIEAGNQMMVIDMSKVDFVDSSGLSALISGRRQIGPKGRLAIAGASGQVKRHFDLTQMHRVFMLHDTAGQAVAHLSE